MTVPLTEQERHDIYDSRRAERANLDPIFADDPTDDPDIPLPLTAAQKAALAASEWGDGYGDPLTTAALIARSELRQEIATHPPYLTQKGVQEICIRLTETHAQLLDALATIADLQA